MPAFKGLGSRVFRCFCLFFRWFQKFFGATPVGFAFEEATCSLKERKLTLKYVYKSGTFYFLYFPAIHKHQSPPGSSSIHLQLQIFILQADFPVGFVCRSCNYTFASFFRVEETCEYTPHPENPQHTLYTQTATYKVSGLGLPVNRAVENVSQPTRVKCKGINPSYVVFNETFTLVKL